MKKIVIALAVVLAVVGGLVIANQIYDKATINDMSRYSIVTYGYDEDGHVEEITEKLNKNGEWEIVGVKTVTH